MRVISKHVGIHVYKYSSPSWKLWNPPSAIKAKSKTMASCLNHLLTPFATRYGALPEKHFSGLTQAPEISPRSLSNQERQQIAEVEAYQRSNLRRFTTRELRQLDCLPDREVKAANLREMITPILQRDRWELHPWTSFNRTHLYLLKNGRGFWTAHNDEVWRILEPILKLASRIPSSMHLRPWVREIYTPCVFDLC